MIFLFFFFFCILCQEEFWRLAVGIIHCDKCFPMWLRESKTATPTWKQAMQKISPLLWLWAAEEVKDPTWISVSLQTHCIPLQVEGAWKKNGASQVCPCSPGGWGHYSAEISNSLFSTPWLFLQRTVPRGCGDSHSPRWWARTQQMHSLDPLTMAGGYPPWHYWVQLFHGPERNSKARQPGWKWLGDNKVE